MRLEQTNSELRSQITRFEFTLDEMQIVLSEKDSYIRRLLREERGKTRPLPFSSTDDSMRRKIDELKRTIIKITHEKDAISEKLMVCEKTRQREAKLLQVFKNELEKANVELQSYRQTNDKGDYNDYASLRKKTELIKLESELRNKNIYIDSLLEAVKGMYGKSNGSAINRSLSRQKRISSRNESNNMQDSSKNSLSR